MITFHFKGKEEAFELSKLTNEKQVEDKIVGNEIHIADNLDFLKANYSRLKNKVKCIYIDPPYNTGKDFLYKDKWKKGKECRHSKWLSFMYPRLILARELLKEDGVIFVSIDDNEQANLKLMMTEIFGEENFVGEVIRKTKSTTNDAKSGFNIQHESCLLFAKDKSKLNLSGDKKTFENYKNPDNDPNGDWISGDPSAKTGSNFDITNPFTGKIDLPPVNCAWRFSKTTFEKYLKEGKIKFKTEHKANERGFIFKRYKAEVKSEFNLLNSLDFSKNDYMNQVATKETNNKIFENLYFDYPKPVNFIKNIIKSATKPNDIILDFFAGSGTTGQAVMELNFEEVQKQKEILKKQEANQNLLIKEEEEEEKQEAGGRKFVLVQLPEKIDEKKEAFKAGYKKISDITIERVKRASEKYEGIDNGFKVFNK